MAVPVADAGRRRPAALLAGRGAFGGGARCAAARVRAAHAGRARRVGPGQARGVSPRHPRARRRPGMSGCRGTISSTSAIGSASGPATDGDLRTRAAAGPAPKELRDDQRHPDPRPDPRPAPGAPPGRRRRRPGRRSLSSGRPADGLAEAHREARTRCCATPRPTSPRCGRAPPCSRCAPARAAAPRAAACGTLLGEVAPELGEWAAFFASCSATRAAAEAGIERLVSSRDADDLLRQAEQFVELVTELVEGR